MVLIKDGMSNDVMEDYLEAIYRLERAEETPISTPWIAEYLDVTPPTVTSTIENLAERGPLERETHTGVELTDGSETVAVGGDEQSLPESVARSVRVTVSVGSDDAVAEGA